MGPCDNCSPTECWLCGARGGVSWKVIYLPEEHLELLCPACHARRLAGRPEPPKTEE